MEWLVVRVTGQGFMGSVARFHQARVLDFVFYPEETIKGSLHVSELLFGPEHYLKRLPWLSHFVLRASLRKMEQWEGRVRSASASGGVCRASARRVCGSSASRSHQRLIGAPAQVVEHIAPALDRSNCANDGAHRTSAGSDRSACSTGELRHTNMDKAFASAKKHMV